MGRYATWWKESECTMRPLLFLLLAGVAFGARVGPTLETGLLDHMRQNIVRQEPIELRLAALSGIASFIACAIETLGTICCADGSLCSIAPLACIETTTQGTLTREYTASVQRTLPHHWNFYYALWSQDLHWVAHSDFPRALLETASSVQASRIEMYITELATSLLTRLLSRDPAQTKLNSPFAWDNEMARCSSGLFESVQSQRKCIAIAREFQSEQEELARVLAPTTPPPPIVPPEPPVEPVPTCYSVYPDYETCDGPDSTTVLNCGAGSNRVCHALRTGGIECVCARSWF